MTKKNKKVGKASASGLQIPDFVRQATQRQGLWFSRQARIGQFALFQRGTSGKRHLRRELFEFPAPLRFGMEHRMCSCMLEGTARQGCRAPKAYMCNTEPRANNQICPYRAVTDKSEPTAYAAAPIRLRDSSTIRRSRGRRCFRSRRR